MDNELIPHSTISAMVDNWQMEKLKIENAVNIFQSINSKLEIVFGDHCYLPSKLSYLDSKEIIKEMQVNIWRSIIGKTEIRRFLTTKRIEELDKSIQDGSIGDVTVENVLNLFRSASSNLNTLMQETICEVFELLRPHMTGYKNNEKFAGEIGKTVVLSRMVQEWNYGGRSFNVNVYYSDKLRIIENGFRLLDGKNHRESYYSELQENIDKCVAGLGETEYFNFKCYKNGNLHLTFKRIDLVSKMNQIVSGNVLRKAV